MARNEPKQKGSPHPDEEVIRRVIYDGHFTTTQTNLQIFAAPTVLGQALRLRTFKPSTNAAVNMSIDDEDGVVVLPVQFFATKDNPTIKVCTELAANKAMRLSTSAPVECTVHVEADVVRA